jgi:ribosomal protein L7Ae-like RNA K-turn-binding protein
VGVDAVRAEVQAGRARCVVLAADASPRAIEKVMRLAKAKGVPLVAGPTAAAIGEQFGKPPVMAVGVRDRGLAAGIVRSAPAVQSSAVQSSAVQSSAGQSPGRQSPGME